MNNLNPFEKNGVITEKLPSRHFPMKAPHVTTCNLMEFSPVVCMELRPQSRGKFRNLSFTRLEPLQRPVLGQCKIQNRAFWVRAASVFRPFYELMADVPHVYETSADFVQEVPKVSPDILFKLFYQDDTLSIYVGDHDAFDFACMEGNDEVHLKFTPLGRRFYKILRSCGYDIKYGDLEPLSLLPLMALAKIYIDWYYPASFANFTSEYISVVRILMRETAFTATTTDIKNLLKVMDRVCYESDYFTSAWQTPVAPNTGGFSQFNLIDESLIYGENGAISDYAANRQMIDDNGTPILRAVVQEDLNPESVIISTQAINTINAMTMWMRRHQLSGARVLDRWLADYGLSIRADKLNRSIYLGSSVAPIQFGDVMSHADTSGAVLGQYTGKGVGFSEGSWFDFDSKEDFGFLFIVSSVVPEIGYVQGIDPMLKHISKFDFHHGDFDGLGTRPIGVSELATFPDTSSWAPEDKIFGFTPRYSEYKFLRSRLTGDFACNSVNTGLDSWHLFRMFTAADFDGSAANCNQSLNFVRGGDAGQYNRVFNITNPDLGDAFTFVHWIEVDMTSPMRPMFDDYAFHDAKGQKIDMHVNGVQLN